jgi:hypothetical protein
MDVDGIELSLVSVGIGDLKEKKMFGAFFFPYFIMNSCHYEQAVSTLNYKSKKMFHFTLFHCPDLSLRYNKTDSSHIYNAK